jgi:cell division protein FtsB
MELFARLENIEFHIKQLKGKCDVLEKSNEQLTIENKNLKQQLESKTQALLNTEETNKISKLAQSAGSYKDTSAFKSQIDQIILEIDQCLTLIKQ